MESENALLDLLSSVHVLCKENFTIKEDAVVMSEIVTCSSDNVLFDKTAIVQNDMILKEKVITKDTIFPCQDSNISSASCLTFNEGLVEEMEIASQSSLESKMDLGSQENTDVKMESSSQESSKMDALNLENSLYINTLSNESAQEVLSYTNNNKSECNFLLSNNLKRKHNLHQCEGNGITKNRSRHENVLFLREKAVRLREKAVGLRESLVKNLENNQLIYKNVKRRKK